MRSRGRSKEIRFRGRKISLCRNNRYKMMIVIMNSNKCKILVKRLRYSKIIISNTVRGVKNNVSN